MAQYLKFPDDNPSVWDYPNFKDAWLSDREWVKYMNHLLQEGDPSAKTFQQYPRRTFVVFVPINVSGYQNSLGPHLVSFLVDVKGDVIAIQTNKIYRHGFINPEIYQDILEGVVEWTDCISEIENEMIDEIKSNPKEMGPIIPFPLVNSYGEFMELIQKWFAKVSSK